MWTAYPVGIRLPGSCGAPFQELEVPAGLIDVVFVQSLNCFQPIEALYYSAEYEAILCIYCAKP